jgi:hypothetical protein
MLLRVNHGGRKIPKSSGMLVSSKHESWLPISDAGELWNESKAGSISARADLANLRRPATRASAESSSKQAVEEINAYIAIRDILLVEAKEVTTRARLDRLTIANEFVETCLRPPRSPYEAQCLAEIDAIRERKRCASVKVRIAELLLLVVRHRVDDVFR